METALEIHNPDEGTITIKEEIFEYTEAKIINNSNKRQKLDSDKDKESEIEKENFLFDKTSADVEVMEPMEEQEIEKFIDMFKVPEIIIKTEDSSNDKRNLKQIDKMNYIVVKFPDEGNFTGIIHRNWVIEENKCRWPIGPNTQAHLRSGKVMDSWPIFPMIKIYETESLKSANAKAKLYQCCNDDFSEEHCISRERKKRQRSSSLEPDYQSSKKSTPTVAQLELSPLSSSRSVATCSSFSFSNNIEKTQLQELKDNIIKIMNFQEKMFLAQEEQRQDIASIKNLIGFMKNEPTTVTTPTCPFTYPITTLEEYETANNQLQDNSSKQKFIDWLSHHKGIYAEDTICSWLKLMIDDNAFCFLNWTGKPATQSKDKNITKACFKDSIICSSIFYALRKLGMEAQLKETNLIIQSWLRRGVDRYFRRHRKNKVATAHEEGEEFHLLNLMAKRAPADSLW